MAEQYASGHHQHANHQSAPSSDDDISSATVQDPSSQTLLDDHGRTSQIKSDHSLRSWCYGLHAFLVVIHLTFVAMIFTHPEHRFSVSIDNTTATIALKIFLQAFYTIFTAVLVFIMQRLVIFMAMAKRQKLTAIHDICSAWNGIGAAIYTLWQQTKVMSSPSTILLILMYLTGISGLHVISSSVIQFEAFNNTISSVVPSTLALPFSPANLTDFDWANVTPLTALWQLLPNAMGLSGNMLFDVPSSNSHYTGAIVNASTITADCGLLPNTSAGTWNSSSKTYFVNVSGLGDVSLSVAGANLVSFITLNPWLSPCPFCSNYVAFQIALGIDLGNLVGQVIQLDVDIPIMNENAKILNTTMSTTSYFVACTLNATDATHYLPIQNGEIHPVTDTLLDQPWKIWEPGPTTELTKMINTAQQMIYEETLACIQVQSSDQPQCAFPSVLNVYLNNLLNVPWTIQPGVAKEVQPSSTTLGYREFEDAVAQVAASLIWLASTFEQAEGIEQTHGESTITSVILELRLNLNTIPVIVGLSASCMMFAIMAWMLYGSHPRVSRSTVSNPTILELMWISSHFTTLQDFMRKIATSFSYQLRVEGVKTEICLLDTDTGSDRADYENLQLSTMGYIHNHQPSIWKAGLSLMHLECYVLHGIFFALHVVLILLLMHHPEHAIIMPVYDTWVVTMLSICLQAFYVLYTAVLAFIVQQLATSKLTSQRHYLTTVHDITNAWTGLGAAMSTLWQQKNPPSSIWAIIMVVLYLACVSIIHISSTTIMQFTPYNSISTTSISTQIAWPDSYGVYWTQAIHATPPISLVHDLQTKGLLNNTIYDVLNTTDASFVNATVNATSVQATCGLLPNLSFANHNGSLKLNFSTDGLGQTGFSLLGALNQTVVSAVNQVVNLQPYVTAELIEPTSCPLCNQFTFFLITANIEVDESAVTMNETDLYCNTAPEGEPPVKAYLAACSLTPNATHVTLDVQSNNLIPSMAKTGPQAWKLWSSDVQNSTLFSATVDLLITHTSFMICPTNGELCSLSTNATLPEQNSSLHTLTPYQMEQSLEQLIAAKIWMAGEIGPSLGGFQRANGSSPVTQVFTEWRLNINEAPVVFASAASLLLLILTFFLVGMSSTPAYYGPAITGVGVLETLWVAAHSRTIHEHMTEVKEPSVDNLRKAGMFKICLGDIYPSQNPASESKPLLE